ncbi:MAG: DUF523 and DUF1722 domain-containing protein [Nitrococcus sp.]|nr:DUF523 and DUF1722 domain-containing protein [Nitrococcus sp.]
MDQPLPNKIQIGVSGCLLGQQVRHDGGHKRSRYCTEVLSHYFDFQPLCPEMGAGLGTPRQAMHLVETDKGIRLRPTPKADKEQGDDYTDMMNGFIRSCLGGLRHLRGFILMPKSPSCGMERVRIYNENSQVLRHNGSGLFANALMHRFPVLPVEEAGRLNDQRLRENFIERVFFYDDWCRVVDDKLTPAALLDFHTRHKFQLLAHDQATYRELGPMLANLKVNPLKQIAENYIGKAMQAMSRIVSPGANVNVMQHIAGYFRDELEAHDRAMIGEQIDAYQRGDVPLVVPMTLVRNAQRKIRQPYLGRQDYLHPYPDALGLRNEL